ncbi:helix-turn-helix domain-containing protein [Campylobacter fetus]|uniref:helix-turn-helix domain-containing protein n=1 Tax=Campylobacter fetus TaxID=196 RepID=UPI0009B7E9A5|nr:helix-turn-helix domain-containing protein [Campylobacter fetus]QMS60144.1 helix-turn-helix domain-containing protein [Campylobacter fetus]WKW20016.1 helix-turn-helix domain-containing protein [Campylobacter fetus subsp. venerealis]WKW22091.1 helix-turn-helix domain-containing protein [Campylobacter fetus subsp. venerealis]WKW24171.1 helix-turn-helix domain-containing protein [Campylobacter fetus subsp. venerealis]WKW26215.1 helix-turn-helix domain-containing protein [Campylobacter fetus su
MEKKLHNPTLRVLEIFKVLFVNNNGLSFSEISQITGISKGTLHPILTTLIYEDFFTNK